MKTWSSCSPSCRRVARTCCFSFPSRSRAAQHWFESSTLSTQSKHLLWALPAWETSPLCSRSSLDFAKECIVGEDKRAAPCQHCEDSSKGSSVTAGVTEIKLEINCLKHRLESGQSWGVPGIALWKKKIIFCLLQIRQSSALVMFSPWWLLGCHGISKGRGWPLVPQKGRDSNNYYGTQKMKPFERNSCKKNLLEHFRS